MGRYLAVDLGATSGRVTAGRLVDGRLEVREAHRFANRPFEGDDGLRWDVEALFEATLTGLAAGSDADGGLDGIATSTWGVDYGLVDDDGRLLEPPGHYRSADRAARERVLARRPRRGAVRAHRRAAAADQHRLPARRAPRAAAPARRARPRC